MKKIKEYYKKQAKKFGNSKQSTMYDNNVRDKEVEEIILYLKKYKSNNKNYKILEIGCGNGYTAEQIVKRLSLRSFVCIDICKDFIDIAKKRNLPNIIFDTGNILDLKFDDSSFDFIFTERCLINLGSFQNQKNALLEIQRVLKPNGIFLMIEAFTDGLNNLNAARTSVGLDPIPQPFYNYFFEKKGFFDFIKGKFKVLKTCENFLSTYYFGSRVLYPALLSKGENIVYNNKFVEFFGYLPPLGNYSYIQVFILRKI